MARDRHGFGRSQGGGHILGNLTMVSKLACGTRGKFWSRANGRIGLSGGGREVIGITLRGNQEGVKGIILVGMKRMRLGKRIVLAGNLCL
jgi:hypothetical protein